MIRTGTLEIVISDIPNRFLTFVGFQLTIDFYLKFFGIANASKLE